MSILKQVDIAIINYMDIMRNRVDDDNNPYNYTQSEDAAKKDLTQHGFFQFEINEILDGQPTKETIYKFLAYYVLLYNTWTNKKRLMKLIDDHPILTLEEFTDEDLDAMVKIRETIKY